MVLPLTIIIECGNHIAQIKGKDRYWCKKDFHQKKATSGNEVRVMIESTIDRPSIDSLSVYY